MTAETATGGSNVLSGDEVTRVLDHQTAVMEQIAAGTPLPIVLDGIVLALEDLMDDSCCSILLLDDAGLLRHGSAPNLAASYSAAIDGLRPGPSAGSCGTAVHLATPVVAVDLAIDERWEAFRELAAEHSLQACWSSPIWLRDQIVGTFAVYHAVPYQPAARDDELLRRFTHLASLAVEHDRAAAEGAARREAEMARRGAEQANHAKSQFVTAISHELRTPLQAITGFTENLKTLDLTPERRHAALDQIDQAAEHILSIVDDVLDLARVEAGAMPFEVAPVDADELVAASIDLIAPLAERREVLVTAAGSGSAVALADRRRLQQVILNLLSNAVRFSSAGSAIEVTTGVGDNGEVEFHVVDEGPGIPDELLARLFVPFDRLGADAGREGGAGLGLVLARRLTEAMSGTLTLNSEVGRGTHATITIPPAD